MNNLITAAQFELAKLKLTAQPYSALYGIRLGNDANELRSLKLRLLS